MIIILDNDRAWLVTLAVIIIAWACHLAWEDSVREQFYELEAGYNTCLEREERTSVCQLEQDDGGWHWYWREDTSALQGAGEVLDNK